VIEVTHDITALKRTEEKLKTSLREKEILLKEVHHRVQNNLQIIISMLNLEMAELPQGLGPMIEEIMDRVQVFADIHSNLYQFKNVSEVDIRYQLQETFQRVRSSRGGDPSRFTLKTDIPDPLFDLTLAVPLGLLLNELMTHSFTRVFKENEKGEISIKIERHSNGKVSMIEYSDHHRGVPNLKGGFGETLIRSMAAQLGLEYEITKERSGTYNFSARSFKRN
jgi:two-component sensor histidine kinase